MVDLFSELLPTIQSSEPYMRVSTHACRLHALKFLNRYEGQISLPANTPLQYLKAYDIETSVHVCRRCFLHTLESHTARISQRPVMAIMHLLFCASPHKQSPEQLPSHRQLSCIS